MQLDKHLESVRQGVQQAAALADEHSQDIARRLGDAVESSVRLSLIDALSDASAEISADLAPGSVEFRLSNGEPQFVVTPPPAPAPVVEPEPEVDWSEDEDSEQVRITLRLPSSVKKGVDEAADAEGVSTNTWLLQQIRRSLARKRSRSGADNFASYIESTVENAMDATFGPFSDGSWGGSSTGPTSQAPFPSGFPFGSDDGRNRNRKNSRTKNYKGWAQ